MLYSYYNTFLSCKILYKWLSILVYVLSCTTLYEELCIYFLVFVMHISIRMTFHIITDFRHAHLCTNEYLYSFGFSPCTSLYKWLFMIGIGTTLHKFKNDKGKDVFLPCVSYHTPTTYIRLFSPKTYHQMHGGNSYLCGDCAEMNLKENIIVIMIRHELANLPIVYNSFVSAK